MEVKRICALYFSPPGNTRRAVCAAANALAEHYQLPCEEISVTLPHERVERDFGAGDLVVVGAPTYAGKLPNKMLPYFQSGLHGNGALAAAVVTYGNRSFDNSLAELCASLEMDGFHTAAGGAFVGTHAFSDALAPGRPGEDDLHEIERFAAAIAEKVDRAEGVPAPVVVDGDAAAPYYVPKGTDGAPAKFLKATPKTDAEKCTRCGLCASQCRWAPSVRMIRALSPAFALSARAASASARSTPNISTMRHSCLTCRCWNRILLAVRRIKFFCKKASGSNEPDAFVLPVSRRSGCQVPWRSKIG